MCYDCSYVDDKCKKHDVHFRQFALEETDLKINPIRLARLMGGNVAHDLHICPMRRFGEPTSQRVWVPDMSEDHVRSVFQYISVLEILLVLGANHPGLSWFFVTCYWKTMFVDDYCRWFGHTNRHQDVDADLFDDDE